MGIEGGPILNRDSTGRQYPGCRVPLRQHVDGSHLGPRGIFRDHRRTDGSSPTTLLLSSGYRMTDPARAGEIDERVIAGLTIRIDRLLCVGFGDCIEQAPEVFEFDGETIAVFTEESTEASRSRILAACDSCPVDALTVLDEDGEQVVP